MISWTGLSGLAQGGQPVLHRLRQVVVLHGPLVLLQLQQILLHNQELMLYLIQEYTDQETVTEGCMLVAVIIDHNWFQTL